MRKIPLRAQSWALIFPEMQTCLRQNPSLLPTLLKTFPHLPAICQLHAHLLKTGLLSLPFPASNLLAAAAAHCSLYSHSIFSSIPHPNLFQHNTLLRSFSLQNQTTITAPISLFNSLRRSHPTAALDQFSFIPTLKICATASALSTGQQIHALAINSAFHHRINVHNSLIHFYCACTQLADADRLFNQNPKLRDAVTYSTLMGGYLHAGRPITSLHLFRDMHSCDWSSHAPSIVTALSAAAHADNVGELLHGYCVKSGFHADLNVATAVVTMYLKTGDMDSAREVFDYMCKRDVVLYNCMVDGYARGGVLEESMGLIRVMREEGVGVNSSTLVGLLSACAVKGALGVGRHAHRVAREEGLVMDGALGTALVDMYSKCGNLKGAIEVFDGMRERDVKAWTTMIMGLGTHGRADDALRLFRQMEEHEVTPNEVTFLAVLSACCHGGKVALGREFFERMVRDYGLSPKMEHYGCTVDLFRKAGMLKEAHELIKSLPVQGDATAWRALLSACRDHGDVKLAEAAYQALVALGDEQPGDLILLSSTYRFAGISRNTMHVDDYNVREKTMPKKEAGHSSIELVA